jgi:hypothetical protein
MSGSRIRLGGDAGDNGSTDGGRGLTYVVD